MIDLSEAFKKRSIKPEKKPYKGFDSFVHGLVGKMYRPSVIEARLLEQGKVIYRLSEELHTLEGSAFYNQLQVCYESMHLNRLNSEDGLNKALAHIVENCHRILGIRPYPVQIMGALALYKGYLIEMHTGEGKTITASLAAILYGWGGKPCHVVTSNSYLAQRDAEELRQFYEASYLSVASLLPDMEEAQREESYKANILYTTSQELLADFLRDQIKSETASNVNEFLISVLQDKQESSPITRGLYVAIIDEADNVLADEATTPLIISVVKENKQLKETVHIIDKVTQTLKKDVHYKTNEIHNEVYFLEDMDKAIKKITKMTHGVWKSENRIRYLVRQALLAREFYHQNEQYVIEEGKIVIIDEKSGRMVPNRSWGGGLHQAVEAKENIELTDPTQTHIKMSFQRYFRLYYNLCGMSGTLGELSSELWSIYNLKTLNIPKRIPNSYSTLPEQIYKTKKEKWLYVLKEIERVNETQRPILIGTYSIRDSEALSKELDGMGIKHNLLHALYHKEEAEIISQAGKLNSVTIATNMAGRGTDIHIDKAMESLGGLHVVVTEKHKSKRVDRQLFGRTARQGQPGSVRSILSLEDENFVKYVPKRLQSFLKTRLEISFWQRSAIIVYILIQYITDRKESKMRKKVLQNEFKVAQMLSFSDKLS